MKGNVAFTMKDVVFLAVSFYLLKQDVVRASRSAAEQSERQEVGGTRAWAAEEVAATNGTSGWSKADGSSCQPAELL